MEVPFNATPSRCGSIPSDDDVLNRSYPFQCGDHPVGRFREILRRPNRGKCQRQNGHRDSHSGHGQEQFCEVEASGPQKCGRILGGCAVCHSPIFGRRSPSAKSHGYVTIPNRGHSANLTKYLLGKMTSNAELGGADHLARQKLAGLDFSSRARMADRSKRRIIMNGHAFHPKYCDALALFPWWRASLSIKNNLGAHGGRDHSRNSI